MCSKSINLIKRGGAIYLMLGLILCSTCAQAFNGPHMLAESPCDVCHIPHHAADDMLWARVTPGTFSGVKKLCASCHGTGLYGAKDRFGIFESEGGKTYDHVMGEQASISAASVIRTYWEPFPLKETEGGDGFYCGSCHDPHQDPYEPAEDQGGGDYLREEVKGLIKNMPEKETFFCTQCHEDIVFGDAYGHGTEHGCFDCHHPHGSPNPGSKILISPLVPFVASPNCPGFSDSEENVSACYGCHREGSGFRGSIGAPLAGDDVLTPKEHHPMGLGANASTLGHQPTQAGPLSPAGELYCHSCHSVHDGTNDHYINIKVIPKFNPINSSEFCVTCHSDKIVEDLGKRGEDHHQIAPYNQCLFCHSIHNSPNDPDALFQTDEDEATQDNASASVDVIMRIAPVNLAWSDKILDTDTRDYEDACYGCHSQQDIVGKEYSLNQDNSLLFDNIRDRFFSHRFDAIPSADIKQINTFDDRISIVSDGKETEVINDYAVEEGKIWCGSCHNVHRQNMFSSEVAEEYKERRSAYLRADNYGSSFCYRCHTTYHEVLGIRNHPQDKPLEGGVPPLYFEGFSGGNGGLTNGSNAFDTAQGEVVCQTCHSVHSAGTNWDGGTNEDDQFGHGRLIIRPLEKGFCQDCHVDAHGGTGGGCLACHSPHHGQYMGILRYPFEPKRFAALPNVPYITEDPNNLGHANPSLCYGCHRVSAPIGWVNAGARPIFGDDATELNLTPNEHHPMGAEATTTSPRADVPSGDYFNEENQLTCKSCHDGVHGPGPYKGNEEMSKQNLFLRWKLHEGTEGGERDKIDFCIACHPDKETLRSVGPDNKHYWVLTDNSPNKRGGCMFCHFIHDGFERGSDLIPEVDALMRQPAKNLAWGDRSMDTDTLDYEDMCYGCHGELSIVKGSGGFGSLLQPNLYFTHRFAAATDPNSATSDNIVPGGIYPLSDGPNNPSEPCGECEGKTLNDYGTIPNHIYCGSCHNVHNAKIKPYLNHDLEDSSLALDKGFCEACHEYKSGKFEQMSHPLNNGPKARITKDHWDIWFYQGGSGEPYGITGDGGGAYGTVVCLTCHNVHTAVTNWNGGVSSDPNSGTHGKLLVKDNKTDMQGQGSDMCQDCHNFNYNY